MRTIDSAGEEVKTLIIRDVRLASGTSDLYEVLCEDGRVISVSNASTDDSGLTQPENPRTSSSVVAGKGGLLLPSLCHAHIHLDKCYMLDQCELVTGDFLEAIRVTSQAKRSFPSHKEELYQRGKRLMLESIEAGVTCVRAHVEVDQTVNNVCLDTAIQLKQEFANSCDIQISAFAQDPLVIEPREALSSPRLGANWDLLRAAAAHPAVEVVGSAPYVEATADFAEQNIMLVFDLAHAHNLHADFHLDYSLDLASEPLIWFVIDILRQRIQEGRWKRDRHVCVGHATRLTLWTSPEWARFAKAVADDDLPITLVGLPQSDMYTAGKGSLRPPRGTLNPIRLAEEHGLKIAMSVNNVGNAFTPQGTPDPLSLCPLGVALFQAGTKSACQTLLESVTINARTALGGKGSAGSSLVPGVGDLADFVLLYENHDPQSAACSPSYARTTIKAGRAVSCRESRTWHLEQGAQNAQSTS